MSNRGSSLTTGGYLATNDYLSSPDGNYFAIMQSDGNFVIYHGNGPTNQGAFVWNSGIVPRGDSHFFVIMQNDGNLVIYHGDPLHQGAFVWNSGTTPSAGQYVATLQNDGNLVITTTATKPSTVVWSSQHPALPKKGSSLAMGSYLVTNDYLSSPDGSHFAIMQRDGNLVVYHGSSPTNQGAFVWNSGVVPGGDPRFFLVMQNDGNLVVYRGDPLHQGAFVWNSGIAPGTGQYVATLQNDGNLVVTTADTEPSTIVWSAQPLPFITLTIVNQMEVDSSYLGVNDTHLVVSITPPRTGMHMPSLTLEAGESGSLHLPLNTTTEVLFEYGHSWCDSQVGITFAPGNAYRSYTVTAQDTTPTVSMVVGGNGFVAGDNQSWPTFTETLPPEGVTANWTQTPT